jgi:hypothetical protein
MVYFYFPIQKVTKVVKSMLLYLRGTNEGQFMRKHTH